MKRRWSAKRILIYILAVLLVVWTLTPIYWLLNMSAMYKNELLATPTHLYPHLPTITNFTRMMGASAISPEGTILNPVGQGPMVRRGLVNSLIVSVLTTALTMAIGMPVAYALGRYIFRFRTALLFAIIFSRSYPPIAVLIPFFMLYRVTRLQATLQGLIIIYLTATVPIAVWIMSGFFASLPRSLEAAARVDGNTRFQAFYRVMARVALPGLAATAAICFMIAWNEFTFALVLTTGSNAQTFPPTLSSMFHQISFPNEMAAAVVMAMIPPMVLAYIFQRQIQDLNLIDPL